MDRPLANLQILGKLGGRHVGPFRFRGCRNNNRTLSFQEIWFQNFDNPLGDGIDVLRFKLDFHGEIIPWFRKRGCFAVDVLKK